MDLSNVICRALKHLRKISGKSQDEVCADTGISVSNYEIEKRLPTVENIQILCDYYNFNSGSLINLANTSLQTGIPVENLLEDKLS